MSLKLAFLSLIAVLPLNVFAQTNKIPAKPHSVTAKEKASTLLKGHTPAERLLMPYLNARVTTSSSEKPSQQASIRPASAPGANQPNFGGYLTAPFYPGRLESSCIADPFNCGVTVNLTADFNQDGKPDIAVIQSDGTLNILLNDGSGGLSTPVSYLNPTYSSSFIQQGFAVDINNDGYADILEFDSGNNVIITFLNLKNGTFDAGQRLNLDSTYGYVSSIALGDVNNDKSLDVVAVTASNASPSGTTIVVQTYLGTGSGSFTIPGSALTKTVAVPGQVQIPPSTGVTLGDLNKDGKLDIAVDIEEQTARTAGSVVAMVALGDGDGTFGQLNVNNPVIVPVSAPPGFPFLIFDNSGVQITDLNNDSNNDLVIDAGQTLYVALGNGSGGFTSIVQTPNIGESNQILYSDVTGDGIPDLIQENGLIDIWIGKGDGTFSLPINGNTYIEDGGGYQSLALADFNGDGNPDIAQLGGDYKQVSIFLGNGSGAFQGAPALSSSTDPASAPAGLLMEDAEDILGNGFTDPIFIDVNGAAPYIASAISNGKGGFTYTTALASSAVPNLAYIQPVSADFDGDGKQDLLIAGSDNSLSVSLSKGDGTFLAPIALALPSLDCEVNYAATGDVNGDGHVDIVVAYPGDAACGGTGGNASGYFVALGNGDGTFATPKFTASGNELYSATLADMNGDGNLDLILDDSPFDGSGSFAVNLLSGNGDGTFSPGTTVYPNFLVSQVSAGDYNQDGKPDLILFTEGEATDTNALDTAGIVLLPGKGDGTFGSSEEIATGNFFLSGALTDVNNDGIPDLVAALYHTPGQPNTYYGLSTILGTGNGGFAAPVNALESLDSILPFPGNFLADNATDFVVSTDYGPALFLGQGGTTFSIAASATSIPFGQAETVTATLSPTLSGRPAPTGSVSFYDGATLLGSVSISSAAAVYTASALAVGSHSITAVYSGDSNFNTNTSAATNLTVSALAPAFDLTATPGNVNVTIGQQSVATLTLASNATFSGSISLACSGLPANASCAINPGQVTLSGASSAQATVIIGTTNSAANGESPLSPFFKFTGGISLAGLFCCFTRRFRRGALWMLATLLLVFTMTGLSGCGGGSSVKSAAKGSYTVTITATPSGSTAASQTATVAVTLQ
jgi:hypothetical protein